MLKILPYEEDITSVLKDLDREVQWKAVTPSPLKSDVFREIAISAKRPEIQSITISKFIKDILGQDSEARKSKSELLMELWTIWKIKESDDYNTFRYVFDLFTEIRSYSLELGVIEEIKELVPLDVYNGLNLFFQYFQNAKVIDEQFSYFLAGDQYNDTGESGFVFWGFDHLNSVQIDMIKSISQKSDVVIPLPMSVLTQVDVFDWPFWLSTEEYDGENNAAKRDLKAYQVPEGRLSEYLEEIFEAEQRITLIDFNKGPDLTQLSSYLTKDVELKTTTDIFSIKVKSIYTKLHDKLDWSKSQPTVEIVDWIEKEKKLSFEQRDMRAFKTLNILVSLVGKFLEYSNENEALKWSDLLIIREVLVLDLPRTSMVSLVQNSRLKILDRDSLGASNTKATEYLFIDKNADKSLRESSSYSADILSVLSAYGPRQNKSFESLVIKSDLHRFVSSGGTVIYEDGAFEDSYEWDQILDDFNLTVTKIDNKLKEQNSIVDVADSEIKGLLSATKIQSYIDCPRKFAYEYKNRVNLLVRGRNQITPDIKGLVEHLLIEKYIENNNLYDEYSHKSLGEELLRKEILTNDLIISKTSFNSALEEIVAYTGEIIQRLLNLKNSFGAKLIFEYDLNQLDPMSSGRVDLIIELDEQLFALDFKRSYYGVPSKKDFEDFKKIQMWFYSQRLLGLNGRLVGIGYLSLSELEKSLVYIIKDTVWADQLFGGIKTSYFKDEFSEKINEYKDYEMNIIEKMNNDTEYIIAPLSSNVCDFCVASPVCTRGGVTR